MARLIFICAALSLSACTALYVPTELSADGGTQDAGPGDVGPGPDAGTPAEPTTPVSCPVTNDRPCGTEKVVCGWDARQTEHVASLRSGLFQVKGLNPEESTLGSEILVTFRAPMAGSPLLVGFSLHRNSSSSDDAAHKLFVDIVPMNETETKPVIPANGESPLASVSYDIMKARRDADTPVSLAFDSATTLVEGRMYALYFHVDSSNADDIALVGHNVLTDNVGTVFQRISYIADEGDLTYTPWVMQKQKSLNYFVTVGGRTPECSNPTALQQIAPAIALCWTDVPAQCPSVNGVSGLCSMDPNAQPYESVWPSLFQIIGVNPADAAGVMQDLSLAFTFSGAHGVPLSLQLVLRRLSSLSSPDSHDLVAEVFPTELTDAEPTTGMGPRLHWIGSPIATGRFDLSTVPFSSSMPVDQRISLNFKASQGAPLNPNQTYGVYLHLAPGSVDRLGFGGVETDINKGVNVYTRQVIGMTPLSVETGLWSAVANRDLDFSLTFADICGD